MHDGIYDTFEAPGRISRVHLFLRLSLRLYTGSTSATRFLRSFLGRLVFGKGLPSYLEAQLPSQPCIVVGEAFLRRKSNGRNSSQSLYDRTTAGILSTCCFLKGFVRVYQNANSGVVLSFTRIYR
jgi:hypothetical protein